MHKHTANIEISKRRGRLHTVNVFMPIWTDSSNDGSIDVRIPLFDISTSAFNEEDVDSAVKECIQLFCLNAEEFGRGVEVELKSLGWNMVESKKNISTLSFGVSERNSVFNNVLQTGSPFMSQRLQLAC